MRPFKFRLEELMRVREAERDQCRGELAAALLQFRQAQSALEAVLRALDECRGEPTAGGAVDVERLLARHRYEAALRQRRDAAQANVADATASLQRQRGLLLEADRELRSVQKLREAQLERHRVDEHRRETLEMDEIGNRAASRPAEA